MAYLTIHRTTEYRCEQCDSTEHVLDFVVSQSDADEIRLTACLICVIVAMDNAMEWNMSRQFAQALANRAAGEQVQLLTKQAKEKLDARLREAADRTGTTVPNHGSGKLGEAVRSDSGPVTSEGTRTSQPVRGDDRGGGTARTTHSPSRRNT